uniref:Integrase catalytic domain-containing protein n=1 Tax=Parastrongyloides trichosuri TaxID=131310 RepID=A0A0N4ZXX7_PARTI
MSPRGICSVSKASFTMIYMRIANLDPVYGSHLDSIRMLCTANAKIWKGTNFVYPLKEIIRELNEVIDNGLAIQIGGKTENVTVRFLTFSSDNLELNQCLRADQNSYPGRTWITEWSKECNRNFEIIRSMLMKKLILGIEQKDFPLLIYTDASYYAFGGTIMQLQEGIKVPLLYWSSTRRNYKKVRSACFLEMQSAITFYRDNKHRLLGKDRIDRYMENAAAVAIYSKGYTQNEQYLAWGPKNVIADTLSRDVEVKEYNEREEGMDENAIADTLSRDVEVKEYNEREEGMDEVMGIDEMACQLKRSRGRPRRGVDQTLMRLKKVCIFERMKEKVEKWIVECQKCNLRKYKAHAMEKPHIKSWNIPEKVWERVHGDLLGPLMLTSSGNKYIFTLVCALSKYVILTPLQGATSEDVITVLVEKIFPNYGVFSILVTDSGLHFKNDLMCSVSKRFGYTNHYTCPNSHTGNGQVERVHRVVNEKLVMNNKVSEWDLYLPRLQRILNLNIHSVTGYSPFYLMYGRMDNTLEEIGDILQTKFCKDDLLRIMIGASQLDFMNCYKKIKQRGVVNEKAYITRGVPRERV